MVKLGMKLYRVKGVPKDVLFTAAQVRHLIHLEIIGEAFKSKSTEVNNKVHRKPCTQPLSQSKASDNKCLRVRRNNLTTR